MKTITSTLGAPSAFKRTLLSLLGLGLAAQPLLASAGYKYITPVPGFQGTSPYSPSTGGGTGGETPGGNGGSEGTPPDEALNASLTPASLTFNPTEVSVQSAYQVLTLKNAGTSLLRVTGIAVSVGNADFGYSDACGNPLPAGSSCSIHVSFTPLSVGTRSGVLSVTTNRGMLHASLVGEGQQAEVALTADTSTNFGTVGVGSQQDRNFTYRNTGTASARGVYASLAGAKVVMVANTCGTAGDLRSVQSQQQCTVTVRYSPTDATALAGAELIVHSDNAGASSLALSGTGATPTVDLTSDSATLDFGTVPAGQPARRTFTYTNTGLVAATGVTTSLGSTANAVLNNNKCGTAASPVTVAANGTCTFDVVFTPTTAGSWSGSVAVAAANTQTLTRALSGQGATAASFVLRADTSPAVDTSGNGVPVTAAGNAHVSNVDYYAGGASLRFDGDDDWYVTGSSSAFGFGTGDFTVTMWAKATGTGVDWLWDMRTPGGGGAQAKLSLSLQSAKVVLAQGNTVVFSANRPEVNVWHKYTVVRQSGVVRLYVDNVMAGSATLTTNYGTVGTLVIGTVGDSPGYTDHDFTGFIDEIMVIKGQAIP